MEDAKVQHDSRTSTEGTQQPWHTLCHLSAGGGRSRTSSRAQVLLNLGGEHVRDFVFFLRPLDMSGLREKHRHSGGPAISPVSSVCRDNKQVTTQKTTAGHNACVCVFTPSSLSDLASKGVINNLTIRKKKQHLGNSTPPPPTPPCSSTKIQVLSCRKQRWHTCGITSSMFPPSSSSGCWRRML